MLFSNWIITDELYVPAKNEEIQPGICLDISNNQLSIPELLLNMQHLPSNIDLTILITDKTITDSAKDINKYIDNLITIFFQPCYYTLNEQPVIFISSFHKQAVDFLTALQNECINQGFKSLITIQPVIKNSPVNKAAAIAIDASDANINYSNVTRNWVTNSPDQSITLPLLLFMQKSLNENDRQAIFEKQKAFMKEDQYITANLLYNALRQNDEYRYQIHLHGIKEKNNQAYLEFQKQDLAKILDFYKYEYEILPLWYKQLGHIIKVLTGKRTFKSLFSDNVKKYNKE